MLRVDTLRASKDQTYRNSLTNKALKTKALKSRIPGLKVKTNIKAGYNSG
jgi:hypothetical protein